MFEIIAIYSLVNTEASYFPRLGDFGRGILFFERSEKNNNARPKSPNRGKYVPSITREYKVFFHEVTKIYRGRCLAYVSYTSS